MKWSISLFVFFGFLLAACTETDEPEDKKAEKLDQLRGEFQFTMNPGAQQATGLARFSLSANTTGVRLPNSKFFFDGKEILPDSTEMNGVFYEISLPAADFYREHTIQLQTADESYSEKFTPVTFALEPGFRDASQEQDLTFGLQGVENDEPVIVSLIDTSFNNNDLVRKIPVKNNRLVIPAADLRELSTGPISAEVTFEQRVKLTRLGLRRAFVVIKQGVSGEFQLN